MILDEGHQGSRWQFAASFATRPTTLRRLTLKSKSLSERAGEKIRPPREVLVITYALACSGDMKPVVNVVVPLGREPTPRSTFGM
jgi:hypothetical protein